MSNYLCLFVKGCVISLRPLTFIELVDYAPNVGSRVDSALCWTWLTLLGSLCLQASFLLRSEDSVCGLAPAAGHQRIQSPVQEVCTSSLCQEREGKLSQKPIP